MENSYSLADIRAATGGMNGNSDMWMWLLFLLFEDRRNNWGEPVATSADVQRGFDTQSILNKLDGLSSGLCDGFYAQNTTMLQGFNGLQRDLCTGFSSVSAGIAENRFAAQQCCCETNRNIDAVRYEAQKNTCDITTAIHAEGEATRALINQNTMQELRDKLADRDRELMTANFQLSQQAQSANIVNELRPCAKPAYITCSPYEATRFSGCGPCACTYA